MKRFYKFLTPVLLLIALAVPLGSRAQLTLTVADDETTNYYVPIYGLWADADQQNQMIYPASMLTAMTGSSITGLKFYPDEPAEEGWGSMTVQVRLFTTTTSAFSYGDDPLPTTGATLVWSGTYDGTDAVWNMTFSTPFVYTGGNLVVDIQTVSDGEFESVYYVGESQDDYQSIYSYNGYAYSQMFLPKATFTYTASGDFCPPPASPAVRNLTTISATIGWGTFSTFTNVSSYSIEYGEHGFVLGSGTTLTTTEDSVDLSNLTAGTSYDVYLFTTCTGGNSDTTFCTFRTPAEPYVDLPYSTGFELTDDTAWAFRNGLNAWYIDTAAHFSGDRGLYISADTGRTNTYVKTTSCNSYAARNFTLEAGVYALSFDWRCVGESGYDYLQVWLAPGSTDMYAASLNAALWTNLTPALGGSNDWQSGTVQFNVPADGDYYLVFQWKNDGGAGSDPAAAVDNVLLRELTCIRPVDFTVTNTGVTSATLAWHRAGEEEEWAISVNGSEWHQVTDSVVTIDTLRANTAYTFRLVAVCEDGDSSFIATTTTTTYKYCYSVLSASANNIGFTSAGISWTPSSNGNPATSVYVELVCNDTNVTNVPAPQTVTGTSVLFSGLQPGTSYTAKIATTCSDHNAEDTVRVTFSTSSCGEITGNTTNSYVPFYGLYSYGYTQTLYEASIVEAMDSITGISYELNTVPSSYPTRTVDVYMGYTSLTSLSTSSYVPVSDLTKVAENFPMNVSQAGWSTINFDTAFIPNGSGKLVVAVVNKTGSWSSFQWNGKTGASGSSVYWYRDGTLINLTNPADGSPSSGTSTFIPNTRFVGQCDLNSCMASNMAVTNSTTTSLEFGWVANGNEDSWLIRYRIPGEEWQYEANTVSTSDSPYTINGLNPGNGYEIALGSLCGTGDDVDTLWNSTVGYTACDMGTLPYTNNFESALGPCWNVRNTSVSSNQLYMDSATSRAILPELPLQTVMIMMSVKGTANGGVQLGVTDDNGQTVEWLDTVAIASSSEFNTVSSTLRGYAGDATRLVLAPIAGTSSVYVDFINIDVNAGCTPVENIAVTNLHGNTATVVWNSDQTSFNVSYRIADSTTWTDTVVTENNIAFTDLNPQTSYEVKVRPSCSQSESFWMTVSFTTPCLPVAVPFMETFNATTLSSCWNRYSGLYSATPTLAPVTSGWYRSTSTIYTDGHMVLNIYGTNCKYWLVTPEMQLTESMQLNFDAAFCRSNGNAPTSVGADDRFIVAITTDGSNWTPLATWGNGSALPLASIPNTGAQYAYDLSEYDNQIVRIAFYGESTESNSDNYLHLDNVTVMRGGCGAPTALTVDTTGYNIATLHWTDTTTAMTGYEVIYGTRNDVDDSNNVVVATGVPTITLTGLQNGTYYYAWVRTNCGEDFNSMWSSSVRFRTKRSCFAPTSYNIAAVGYTTANFSWSYNEDSVAAGLPITGTIVRLVNLSDTSAADIEQTVSGNSITVTGLTPGSNYRVYLTTICNPDTTTAVYFSLSTTGCAEEHTGGVNASYVPVYTFYKYGYSQALYPAEVAQYMDTIRGVSYYINAVGATTAKVNVYMGYTNRTTLDTNRYVPVDSLQLVASNALMDVSHTGWVDINFDTFFVNNGTSDLVVAVQNITGSYVSSTTWLHHVTEGKQAVYWYRDTDTIRATNPSAGSPSRGAYAYVPDIRFNGNCALGSCLPPMLVIDSATTNTVYATLAPGNEDTVWVVEYRVAGDSVWTSTPASSLTTRTITGLQHSTLYEFRAGSVCDGNTYWNRIISHYTECAPMDVPMVENFTNGISPCWMDTLVSLYISNGDIYGRMSSKKAFLKTPVISAAVDTLQVRVGMYVSAANKVLRVGVADENGQNIEWLDSLATRSTSAFNEEIFFIHNYSGTTLTNRRIVIAPGADATSSYYYNVTSVTVERLMPCLPIRNGHVVDSLTTGSSITLDWTDLQSAGNWAIEYGPEGFTRGTGTVQNVTAHPAAINGLTSSTTYDFYIIPVCTADSGMAYGPVSGTTMFVPCADAEYVVIGSETSTTTSYSYPVNNYYNYSLTETIIDSAELGGPKNIAYIGYYFNYSSPTTSKNNVDIYIQPTTKSEFASTTAFDTLSDNAVLVYHGNLNCQQGWNYFTLTTPYSYDGLTNLMVIVDDNSGDYDGSSYSFKTSADTVYKTIYIQNDNTNPDVHNIAGITSGTRVKSRVVMHLVGCGEPVYCAAPASLVTSDTTENSVTLTWVGDADDYEVAFVQGTTWEAPTTGTPVSAHTYNFTGLQPETDYILGVRAICSEDLASEWVTIAITTLEHECMVPTNVQVTGTTFNSAVVNWTPGENETAWELNVTGTNYDTIYSVTTKPFTVTGLTHAATYSVKVRAMCSETRYSEWSDPKTFSTNDCQGVTNMGYSNVTANSATITWTAPQGVTNFKLEYGESGFSQGHGTMVSVTGTSKTLTGLDPESAYDVYVLSVCAEGVESDWSDALTFTTAQQGIDDVDNASISLYPNPASSTVTLTGIEGMATVTVVDMNGRVSGEYTVNDGTLTIDVTEMAQGAYFVRIVGEQVNAIRKLIVR